MLLNSNEFYLSAIPKLVTNNLELQGIWDSHARLMIGKVVSISESFYLKDIQTFCCTNPRCRNSKRVIRHVGLDQIEQLEELGLNETQPEVLFSTGSRCKKTIIRCHNCREEIEELLPFRSTTEFKLIKLKLTNSFSCFSIDVLLVGSLACSVVKLSSFYSFVGFPKLSAEIPLQLKSVMKNVSKSFYFESYGLDLEKNHSQSIKFFKEASDWLTTLTCEKLRFPLLVLICQVIGAANGFYFNVCLPGIDKQIFTKISRLFNFIFNLENAMGMAKSNIINSKVTPKKTLKLSEEIYPNYVNVITDTTKKCILTDATSFIFTSFIPNDQLIIIPIDLSLREEADIILNDFNAKPPIIQIPRQCPEISLSYICAKTLQSYFLRVRSMNHGLPIKFSVNLLSKLAQISALIHGNIEADLEDAEFSIMIHAKLIESAVATNYLYEDSSINQIMSPSISFDYGNDTFSSSANNRENYDGIKVNSR